MDKTTIEEALQEVMAHAVAGHSEVGTYHTFCSDPEHAKIILEQAGYFVAGWSSPVPDYGHPVMVSES